MQVNKELREEIEMWVEVAVHKFNAKDGVVIMGDCSEESTNELLALFNKLEVEAKVEELTNILNKTVHKKDGKVVSEPNIKFRILDRLAKLNKEGSDE